MENGETLSKLTLQFDIKELETRVDIKELTEVIYGDIIKKVDEKDVLGVQVYPKKWPRKVQVLCAHVPAKECLMIQGLNIYGRHIELHEPGQGIVKVSMEDAPLDMANEVLKSWLSQFGNVVDFRNEHLTVNGRRTSWRTGTRHAYMINITESVPPVAKFKHNDNEIAVNVWHYGQTHMRCWWCHDVVEKGHECDKKPVRKCFNCGSSDHMKSNCSIGKACYKCGGLDHISRDCNGHSRSRANSIAMNSDINDVDEYPRLTADGAPEGKQPQPKTDVSAVLIGGSNCRNLEFSYDDNFNYEVEVLAQGGLSIGEAQEKLDECTAEKLSNADIVITHIGSCDFPIRDISQMEDNVNQYVELLGDISNRCPHAQIAVCSVPPRVGNATVNEQIGDFNKLLRKLTENEDDHEKLFFIDNDVAFVDEAGVVRRKLYEQRDKSGVHINKEGKTQLINSIQFSLREVCFKIKLHNAWDSVSSHN